MVQSLNIHQVLVDRRLEEIDLHFEKKGRTEETEIRVPHVGLSYACAIGTCLNSTRFSKARFVTEVVIKPSALR